MLARLEPVREPFSVLHTKDRLILDFKEDADRLRLKFHWDFMFSFASVGLLESCHTERASLAMHLKCLKMGASHTSLRDQEKKNQLLPLQACC